MTYFPTKFAVSSALKRLTSVFGMVTGCSILPELPRDKYILTGRGGRTRTADLWVMSPTSCRCSTPQQNEYLQVDFLNGLNPRTISIAQLKVLPLLHMQPINPVVSRGPYSHKEMGNLILRRASHLDAFSAYP